MDNLIAVLADNPLLELLFVVAPGMLVIIAVDCISAVRGNGSIFDPPGVVVLQSYAAFHEALWRGSKNRG